MSTARTFLPEGQVAAGAEEGVEEHRGDLWVPEPSDSATALPRDPTGRRRGLEIGHLKSTRGTPSAREPIRSGGMPSALAESGQYRAFSGKGYCARPGPSLKPNRKAIASRALSVIQSPPSIRQRAKSSSGSTV
ncbi:hypothetical protein JRF84_09435 [Methylobacterium organophilum]|uniref:hypothetical protein n=1 Tax=Methylobacterium TaxID=407 RepID=UPI0019D013CE|nr:hypothetical protein [Methylobacterium organophilum]MBN6819812.1 hypothetical protein [Methylobacterium organophilum]